jgi:hypothetical protein
MQSLKDTYKEFKIKSDSRFDNFKIDENIGNLDRIQDESYLESSTWLGGDEKFVCLSIDLDKSSALSARKHVKTMAKLYEYFTENIVDMLNIEEIKADYIDIKGDGVFGIYQGDNAVKRAFVAAITFRTFFEDCIRPKFKNELGIDLNCKSAICRDKILVKRIGTRKYNNEVWAGRLVNNAYKLMKLSDKLRQENPLIPGNMLVVSEEIYNYLCVNHYDHAVMSCGCKTPNGISQILWSEIDVSNEDDIVGDKAYHMSNLWCDTCGDSYLDNILNK